jgi:glycosyltransferase involved in cell wall biosynthesis
MLVIENEKAFLLAPTNDRDSFVNHIKCLYDNADVRKEVSERGVILYKKSFTYESIVENMVREINQAGGSIL